MVMSNRTIAFILSAFVAATAAADDLIVTAASVSPSSVLPSAPVWISCDIRNTTDHAVALPTKYIIEFTPPKGEPFLAWQVTSFVAPLPEAYELQPALQAGETRVIDFPTGSQLDDGIFDDKRLWQPGTWSFRVILSSELRSDRLERVPWSGLMGAGFVTRPLLVTPMIRLTVEEPAGIDAEAWKALRSLPSFGTLDSPKSGDIAKQFWDKYRTSRYAPYFGVFAARYIKRAGGDDRFKLAQDIYERVIALDRDGVLSDSLRFGPAFDKALDARDMENLGTAVRKTSDARAALEPIVAQAKHELTRVQARNEIRKLKSPDELEGILRDVRGGPLTMR